MESVISVVITDQAHALVERCHNLRVESINIATQAHYQDAAEQLKAIKGLEKEIEVERKSVTRPIDDAKKGVMDFFRGPSNALRSSESAIKRAMTDWDREQERIRRAEEARLQEIARKEQEKLRRAAERAEKAGREEKAEALRQESETVSTPFFASSTSRRSTRLAM